MTVETKKQIIQKAEKLYESKNSHELLELLLSNRDNFDSFKSDEDFRFQNLLALAYTYENKLSEAEQLASKISENSQICLDAYFVLTYTHLSMREYQKSIEFGKKYLKLIKSSKQVGCNYTAEKSLQCNLYNFIGSASMESKNFDQAIECFMSAIKNDPTNHLPYLNLAKVYHYSHDLKSAKEIVKQGLAACSQINELRMFEQTLAEKPSISACMIVKNEQELLPDCLNSIRDWVDEIIIVDTGSTDKTVEIAQSYGAKVFHQEWEGNFSKHRNYSIDQATSEWIFIIDADERMMSEDIPTLLQSVKNENFDIISINVFNVYGNREETTTFLPSVRLWRKSQNLKYEGIVHNLLDLGMDKPVVRVNARLKHFGYDLSAEKMHNKFLRTKGLLEQQLNENYDNAFAHFNYAQILKADRSRGSEYPLHNNELIIKSASHAVSITNPENKKERHLHLMCLNQLAWAYFHEKQYNKALEYAEDTLTLKPNYLDALFVIGHIYAQQKQFSEAKEAYHNYLKEQSAYSPQTEKDPLILSHIDDRASAYYSLGLIAELENEYDLAKSYYHKSLDVNIGFIETNYRLGRLYLLEKNIEKAKLYFNQQLTYSHKTADMLLDFAALSEYEKDYAQAERLYKEAVELEQFNTKTKIRYTKFLLQQNRSEEALSLLQPILESASDLQFLQQIGDLFFSHDLYQFALDAYSIIENPTSEILNNIGNAYFRLQDYENAEKFYLESLTKENQSSLTFRNLGITYLKSGKNEQAIDYFNQFLKLNPNDFHIEAALADLYTNAKKYQLSLEIYEKLLREKPDNISVLFAISECYLFMGHKDSAKIGFKQILQIAPDFKPAKDHLQKLENPILSR